MPRTRGPGIAIGGTRLPIRNTVSWWMGASREGFTDLGLLMTTVALSKPLPPARPIDQRWPSQRDPAIARQTGRRGALALYQARLTGRWHTKHGNHTPRSK